MELTEEYMAYLRANLSLCSPLVQSLVVRIDRVEKDKNGVKTAVETDIIDQARCLSAMIDPIMGDMYCRGWRRALETLEKSIKAGAERT